MPRSMAGASAILNKVFVVFSVHWRELQGETPFRLATAFLQALNNSSFMNHELIVTDVAFGVSLRVAAVTGRPDGSRLSMW